MKTTTTTSSITSPTAYRSVMQKCVMTLLITVLCFIPGGLSAQSIGDTIRLDSTSPQGVPVHPAAGDTHIVRWANGTIGKVTAIDQDTGWLEIKSANRTGWVVKRYASKIATEGDEPEPEEAEAVDVVVGTWNLEWFKDGKSRGFPENTYAVKGPTYGSRTTDDFKKIAFIITNQLAAKILVLNEINGTSQRTSVEIERLLTYLGTGWGYEIGSSGGNQHVAILYDGKAVRKDYCVEITVPDQDIQGKDIFDRDPLIAKFTLLDHAGSPKNDLVVVGVHLASGQDLNDNHNQAMAILKDRLHEMFDREALLSGEKDILVLGDFNASRYDSKVENFWTDYDQSRFKFKTLSPADGEEYSGTRLAGVPLRPTSKIDYILGSFCPGGISDELVQLEATVNTQLLPSDFNEFRRQASDHLPITVRVRLTTDGD